MNISALLEKLKLSNLSACDLVQVLEHMEDAVYVTGANTELIYMNRAAEDLFGYTLAKMRGKTNLELNSNFERWYPSIIMDSYDTKRKQTQEQWSTYNGKKFLTSVFPMTNKSGEISMVLCVSRVLDYQVEEVPPGQPASEWLGGKVKTNSKAMLEVLQQAQKVAKLDTTVLLTGETGTGKNMVAKVIHDASLRKKKPFIMVNCAAIPGNIIEAELFGYAPYTFSGASPKGKGGLIAAAEGGTIFLDEIGELSSDLQPKILGFLQSQTYMQVGGREEIVSNVRIVTATNRDLLTDVKEGRFRSDLYYRLSVMELHIPPLRERPEDIGLLSKTFLGQYCKKYQVDKRLTQEAILSLQAYSWPGNVRQLKNLMEKLSVAVDSQLIRADEIQFIHAQDEIVPHIPKEKPTAPIVQSQPISLEEEKAKLERRLVVEAFAKYKTCRGVAKQLSISPTKAHKLYHMYCQ